MCSGSPEYHNCTTCISFMSFSEHWDWDPKESLDSGFCKNEESPHYMIGDSDTETICDYYTQDEAQITIDDLTPDGDPDELQENNDFAHDQEY